MSFKIKGQVNRIALLDGFWGIVAKDGTEYRAVNMPQQYKEEGVSIECLAEKLEDVSDMYMWGTIIRIISFKTIN